MIVLVISRVQFELLESKQENILISEPVVNVLFFFTEDLQTSCQTSLQYALNDRKGKRSTYIPRCRNDGTYAAVQCAAGGKTSGCWCVTPDGKPLPDTAVTNGRPDCTRTGELLYYS